MTAYFSSKIIYLYISVSDGSITKLSVSKHQGQQTIQCDVSYAVWIISEAIY